MDAQSTAPRQRNRQSAVWRCVLEGTAARFVARLEHVDGPAIVNDTVRQCSVQLRGDALPTAFKTCRFAGAFAGGFVVPGFDDDVESRRQISASPGYQIDFATAEVAGAGLAVLDEFKSVALRTVDGIEAIGVDRRWDSGQGNRCIAGAGFGQLNAPLVGSRRVVDAEHQLRPRLIVDDQSPWTRVQVVDGAGGGDFGDAGGAFFRLFAEVRFCTKRSGGPVHGDGAMGGAPAETPGVNQGQGEVARFRTDVCVADGVGTPSFAGKGCIDDAGPRIDGYRGRVWGEANIPRQCRIGGALHDVVFRAGSEEHQRKEAQEWGFWEAQGVAGKAKKARHEHTDRRVVMIEMLTLLGWAARVRR